MTKKAILKLSNVQLNEKVDEILGVAGSKDVPKLDSPASNIYAAWDLFESVYGRGGKIKGGSWVLSTVDGGRDVASAALFWKAKSSDKNRVNKVQVIRPRGEMAKAITQAWVCAMLGVSDV